jgi:hypothetical protein
MSRLFAVFAAFAFALLAFGAAAQEASSSAGEPTVAQIYQAANSGNLDRANAMIEQVLKAHPNSARAHYVKAELAARGRHFDVAKRELAAAEKIAPGLPFAKPESVQALRNQLSDSNATAPSTQSKQTRQMGAAPTQADSLGAQSQPQSSSQRGFPWGTLLIVAAIVGVGAMFLRRRQRAMEQYPASYGPAGAQPYAQPGYGPEYPPAAPGAQPYPSGYGQQPSMGSSIARGVGTGLAIGAGAVIAQEMGRRMFEHGNANAAPAAPLAHDGNHPTLDQIDEGMRRNLNTDMGGDNFGMSGGGWDDGGGGGFDGGGGGDGGGGDW